jgi:hypothetical protein
MNAPDTLHMLRGAVEVPDFLVKGEPDAIFAWFSTRRLAIIKGEVAISLSVDDVRALARFVERFDGDSIT